MSAIKSVLKRQVCDAAVVSIITVVKDDPVGLLATVKSLAQLDNREYYELIIWINYPGIQEKYLIDQLVNFADSIVIGQDSGIFDAMNGALELASANLCLFLNARDEIVESISIEEITGPCLVKVQYTDYFGRNRLVTRNNDIKYGIPYCHQGMLLPSRNCKFQDYLKFGADYQFLIDCGVNWPLPILNSGLIKYDTTGVSTRYRFLSDLWTSRVIMINFGFLFSCVYILKSILKLSIKRAYDFIALIKRFLSR